MIITYNKIVNIPAMELKGQTRMGTVSDIVFNKTNFNIAGFLVKNAGFSLLNKTLVVSSKDTVELTPDALIANDDDAFTSLEETVRIKEAVKEGYLGIDQSVYTKSGRRLGKVIDLFIESESLVVTKLIVKSMVSERLIPTTHVVEFKKRKIIIRDDFELAKGSPALAQTLI